jgi:dUTP pyrophosphatase
MVTIRFEREYTTKSLKKLIFIFIDLINKYNYKMKLLVKTLNVFACEVYKSDETRITRGDSGYDLFCCVNQVVEPWSTCKIPLGICAQPINTDSGYYLYPRSSISKTPLGLANSVGIIDNGYRGEICAVVRNYSNEPYKINQGERLFQLCAPDLKPFEIQIVNELESSIRGEGGFGSTGI